MSTQALLTEKEQELIAVGASIAAGCQPCARYHFRVARTAGADEQEIRQVVHDALEMRANATRVMAEVAEQQLSGIRGSDAVYPVQTSLIGQLVALGAAFAVNCAPHVEKALVDAWQMGATESQITAALKIARAVREMAARKAEAVVDRLAQTSASCPADCACHSAAGQSSSEPAPGCCGEAEPV